MKLMSMLFLGIIFACTAGIVTASGKDKVAPKEGANPRFHGHGQGGHHGGGMRGHSDPAKREEWKKKREERMKKREEWKKKREERMKIRQGGGRDGKGGPRSGVFQRGNQMGKFGDKGKNESQGSKINASKIKPVAK